MTIERSQTKLAASDSRARTREAISWKSRDWPFSCPIFSYANVRGGNAPRNQNRKDETSTLETSRHLIKNKSQISKNLK